MSRKMFRVVVILALVALTSRAAQAMPLAGWNVAGGETLGFSAVWEWAAGWFRSVHVPGLSVMWGNAGPEMDPNGGTHPNGGSPITPNTDEGPSMDPNGR